MTTIAKIRNIIHYFIGAVFAYCATNYSISNMNEVQTFILSCLVGTIVGILIGTAIELYQNWFLKQVVDWNDIKRTALGGLGGGILFVCQPHIHFITTYVFYFALFICVVEIIRSQIALRKKK